MALGISLAVVLPAVGTGCAGRPVVSPKVLSSVASHAPLGSRAIQLPCLCSTSTATGLDTWP